MNYDCVTSVGRGKGEGWTVVSAILDRRHLSFSFEFPSHVERSCWLEGLKKELLTFTRRYFLRQPKLEGHPGKEKYHEKQHIKITK